MKRYSTKHFKRILIANNVNIDIDLKTGIVAKNMAKKEKIEVSFRMNFTIHKRTTQLNKINISIIK